MTWDSKMDQLMEPPRNPHCAGGCCRYVGATKSGHLVFRCVRGKHGGFRGARQRDDLAVIAVLGSDGTDRGAIEKGYADKQATGIWREALLLTSPFARLQARVSDWRKKHGEKDD